MKYLLALILLPTAVSSTEFVSAEVSGNKFLEYCYARETIELELQKKNYEQHQKGQFPKKMEKMLEEMNQKIWAMTDEKRAFFRGLLISNRVEVNDYRVAEAYRVVVTKHISKAMQEAGDSLTRCNKVCPIDLSSEQCRTCLMSGTAQVSVGTKLARRCQKMFNER